jgi:CBS domain-containing protein
VPDAREGDVAMQAHDFMTKSPVTVAPDAPTPEIARTLLAHGISAVPVVDRDGTLLGMVSEGDLLGRDAAGRETRRDWWLSLLAEGEALSPGFLASLRHPQMTARDVMSAPVVNVAESAETAEIAHLLEEYRIKRVPVMRDGRVVGIVSRTDLLRALISERTAQPAARRRSAIGDIVAAIDAHIAHPHPARNDPAGETPPPGEAVKPGLSVADFRALAADFQHRNSAQEEVERRAAAAERHRRVADLIDHHIAEDSWRLLLQHAREAAARGEKELLLLRFPADLCTDRGRAINAPQPDWPQTLRGEAAEIYLRWERDLKPGGFHLAARVLDFPGGFPGDIGLFLTWEEAS